MKENRNRVGIAFAVSLVLSFLCGIAVYQSMGFVYAIADDVIMRDIVSGAFTGTPDGHLIFVQYVLGWIISRLYMLNRSVDWYGFFMAGAVFMGLAVVLYRGLARRKSIWWKLVYSGFVMSLFVTGLVFHAAQFEWTISAAVLGASALYLYATIDEHAGKGEAFFESVWIWVLLVLTYAIRSSVFAMILPGFGIAFLWKFIKREGNRFLFSYRQIFLPFAVFAAVGLTILVECLAYQGNAWDAFGKFQTARSDVYDYYGVPAAEANPIFFEELGLDEHELRNLRHYALYLVDDMDADMMKTLSLEAKRQNGLEAGLKAKIKNGIKLAFEQFVEEAYFSVSLPMLLFLIGTVVLAWIYQKQILLPLALFLAAEGLLWLFLGFQGRLPERVAFSMHLVMLLGIAAVFYWLCKQTETGNCAKSFFCEQKKKLRKWLIFAGLMISLVSSVLQWNMSVKANKEKLAMDRNYQLFKEACKEEEEKLFFIESYMAEPVGGAEVTANGNFGLNRCLTLGDWYSTSPLDEERFRMLEIENVEMTILNNPNAFLVVRDVQDPGFYAAYFENKYPGAELVCRDVKVIEGRNYYLYQVQM